MIDAISAAPFTMTAATPTTMPPMTTDWAVDCIRRLLIAALSHCFYLVELRFFFFWHIH